jgi:RNA polymerase sigma-70 factor (ECF subfamily)
VLSSSPAHSPCSSPDEPAGEESPPFRRAGLRPLDSDLLVDSLDMLYRVALALCGSPHDAEDVVQDTCARLLSRPRYVERGREHSYLLVAVRHTFFDRWRGRASAPQQAPLHDYAELLAGSYPSPHEVVESRAVFPAIAGLPEPHRSVIAAVDVAGMSYAETAEALGVPVGTVMSRLYRARSRVVAELGAATA